MLMRDPYAVLGVKRDAGQEEIKAAWRVLAKSVHPDQNQDDPFATVRFTEAGRAYELLRDPERRSKYDRAHREAEVRREMELRRMEQMRRQQSARKAQPEPAAATAEGAEDMVSRIFGVDARQQPGKAANPSASAQPSSTQPSGASSQRQASAKAQPEPAAGETEGKAPSPRRTVAAADIFTGIIRRIRGSRATVEKAPDLALDVTVTIADLLKQARVPLDVNGETLRVHLAPGTTEGTSIRLREQGHRINDLRRGDAVVTVRVAQGPFRVDGFDLRAVLPVTIEDAVLGCETSIEGPEGETLAVTVPAWSSSDQVIRLEGRGLFDAEGGRGHLLVETRLQLWDKPDAKMIDLMRSLREGLYL